MIAPVHLRRRVAVQLLLGFNSGLPFLLSGVTLTTWMASRGVDVGTIGLFALVGLPYSFKVLWAPLLDRYRLPWLGRRRGWLALFGLAIAGALVALAWAPSPLVAGALALGVAVLSASLDIVTDAYRSDVLRPEERAPGNSIFVLGYRLAMLVAGALALVLAGRWGFRAVYLGLAAVAAASVLAVWLAPEPETHEAPPATLRAAVIGPLRELFGRAGAAPVLAFVACYRLGHLLLFELAQPFLVAHGYSPAAIGAVNKGVGLGATLVGVLAGGALVPRLGLRRALLAFGALQAATHLLWVALAVADRAMPLYVAAVLLDNLASGLAIAAFTTFLMGACDRRFSATQMALLTGLSSVASRLLGALAGYAAAAVGWPAFFALTLAFALPGLVLCARLPVNVR